MSPPAGSGGVGNRDIVVVAGGAGGGVLSTFNILCTDATRE